MIALDKIDRMVRQAEELELIKNIEKATTDITIIKMNTAEIKKNTAEIVKLLKEMKK